MITQNPKSLVSYLRNGYAAMQDSKDSPSATRSFVLFYFCELASYITFLILSKEVENQYCLFCGTLIGGLIASFILAQNSMTVKNVLRWSVFVYTIGTLLFLLKSTFINVEYLKNTAYFIFGLGFSASIGLIVSQITERLPRNNRTWSIGMVNAIGFCCPIVIAALAWCLGHEQKEVIMLSIALVLAAISLSQSSKIPEDAAFRSTEKVSFRTWISWLGLDFGVKKEDTDNTSRTFWASALTGLNMVFFFFLFTNINHLPCFSGVKKEEFIFFGYIGLFAASIFWSWQSKSKGARKSIILKNNFIQLLLICVLIFLVKTELKYNYLLPFIAFGFGFTCSWAITLTQSSEQFMPKSRASLMVLLPNLFRFGSLLLAVFVSESKIDPKSNHYYIPDSIELLIVAILCLAISSFALSFLKDRFGTEPLMIDFKNKSIISSVLRKNINNIQKNDKVRYLEEANKILAKHLKETLGGLYYMSAIYHRNNTQTKITTPPFDENIELINKKTFEERNCETNMDKVAFLHIISDKLIGEGYLESTSLWIALDNNVSGLMFWNPGRTQGLRLHEDPNSGNKQENSGTIVINLKEVILPKGTQILPEEFEKEDWKALLSNTDVWLSHILFLEKNVVFEGELGKLLLDLAAKKRNFPFDVEKFKRSLMHFKIDAALYQEGHYYRYCIKPYSQAGETIALLTLKTVCALPKKRLGQLRDFMNILLYEKAAFLIKSKNKELLEANSTMAFEEEHYKKHELFAIKQRILSLKETHPELAINENYIQANNQINHLFDVSSFYMSMMKRQATADSFVKINLRKVLNDKLLIVLSSLDLLGLGDSHIKAIERIKAEILNCLENIPERVHLIFNKTALEIIVLELMKNAIKYADTEKPHFTIQWLEYDEHYAVEFKNNAQVTDEQLNYISGNNDDVTEQHRVSGGIRSIRRILKYFQDTTNFRLNAKRNLDKTKVIVAILIPKSNVKFETQEPDYFNF